MKRILILIGIGLLGCGIVSGCFLLGPFPESPYGVVRVQFNLNSTRSVTYDWEMVKTGKAFLRQDGVTKSEADIALNMTAKTGSCTLPAVPYGSYDIVVELYDDQGLIVYNQMDAIEIDQMNCGVKNIILQRYIAVIIATGTWIEDIPAIADATLSLKQDGIVKYSTNMAVDIGLKTVKGSIDNIYPGSYEICILVKNTSDVILFEGSTVYDITPADNIALISLLVKTGSVGIQINGDVTAPEITNGPSYSVAGTTVTLSWTTNELATSNVCWSETAEFDCQTQLNWAPAGRDIMADMTSHSVAVTGLTEGSTYYYVVYTADACGNVRVSDEGSFVVQWDPDTFSFFSISSMTTYRGSGFTLTQLQDGRILATGGGHSTILDSAEIYDPVIGFWTPTGSMKTVRYGHRAILLPDGKVLVTGGMDNTPATLNSAELYDPVSGTWSYTGSFTTTRQEHTALLLKNGKVLIAAGAYYTPTDCYGTPAADLYNPATGTWAATGSLITCGGEQGGRYWQKEVLLPDGRVLIAGGVPQGVTFANFSSAQVYDPSSETWMCTGSMAIGRRIGFTLTLLSNGNVLVAGGITAWTSTHTAQMELWDPATGLWTSTSPLPAAISCHSGSLLSNGNVLVAGGSTTEGNRNTAYIYDPVNETWTPTSNNMEEARANHYAIQLFNGMILIAGGQSGTPAYTSAEIYGISE